MLVLDASAICDLLLQTRRAEGVRATLDDASEVLHSPSLVVPESLMVLRRHLLRGAIARQQMPVLVGHLFDLDVELHDVDERTALRMIEMFTNVTASDATYVVLAEALEATLVTSDLRLARAASRYCDVTAVR